MQNETVLSYPSIIPVERQQKILSTNGIRMTPIENTLSEILFITSYPPKECGIATYSQDLVNALNNTFNHSFKINICPLAVENEQYVYAKTPEYTLNPNSKISFIKLAFRINKNSRIKTVVIQHEFGFFSKEKKKFLQFLQTLNKPIVIAFHTVLPNPDELLKIKVQQISSIAESIIVMTHASEKILIKEYGIPKQKITVIAHGTHLVPHLDNGFLKNKYALSGKKVLSTFGLLSSGKSIETTLEALPAIIKQNPDVLFLIIGKTHPSVVQQEGEKYRQMLEAKVEALHLHDHVQFINYFLPLPNLLEYLQLTDIYLFTSKDPNQAVSGTFSYAISCGCPVISTPIPHACEVLKNDAGIIIDFEDAEQLSKAVISLLNNEPLRKKISSNGLHRMAPTAWENAAIAHAMLFERMSNGQILLHYNTPNINLDHIKKLTTDVGIIQFSIINQPDINSGYTLDDNARAMIAMCQHFALTKDEVDLQYIYTYFNFIKFCLQPEGYFLNYVSEEQKFTTQNNDTNLEDANGRAIWALGYLISISNILPAQLTADAASTMQTALLNVTKIHSTRAMAFIIKGLYYHNTKNKSPHHTLLITELANRLVQMYRHECDDEWQWFERYLTYANSILSEAMLCAWLATNNMVYKEIAQSSFDFLLYKIFTEKTLNVISNKTWLNKDDAIITHKINGGEQPIDVAYTIIALGKFYEVFKDEKYMHKMKIAFSWFLGNNHLHQIMYNPCTGGCFDGLEEDDVNLNQGAESTVSYLMARLTVEKYFNTHTSSKGSNGDV
ncbi:MAG TPA: glycosyltransferase [Chitinophagaceae bacterium]|nr:glycosyltransferase [Chitinophagaceae bacterium]